MPGSVLVAKAKAMNKMVCSLCPCGSIKNLLSSELKSFFSMSYSTFIFPY